MSLWGFDGEDNSFSAWSSLSQFDDMVWNEFGETNGDHVVPNPNSPQNSWLPNGDRRKRIHCESSLSGPTIRGESATSGGVAESVSELSFDVENRAKEALLAKTTTNLAAFSGGWTGLGRVEIGLTAESEPFGSDYPPTSHETDDTGDEVIKDHRSMRTTKGDIQLYTCKEDASMVIEPFSMPGGGLEMFGSENVVSKADTLLELGWENISNLDDMDKLFRNDTPFEPVMGNGAQELDWPSSSSPPACVLDREFDKPARMSESIVAKAEVEKSEDKTEVVFDDCLPGLVMDSLGDVVADNGSPRSLRLSAGAPVQQHSFPCEDKTVMSCEAKSAHGTLLPKESPTEGIGVSRASFSETERVSTTQAYRLRRHAPNRKRCDDRFKRTATYKKLSPGLPYRAHLTSGRQLQTLPLRLPGQTPLLQPATKFPLQCFPPTATPARIGVPHQLQLSQRVPYIQVAYPIHHVPAISSCPSIPMIQMQQPRSMLVDIHQAVSQGERQPLLLSQASPLVSSWPFEVSNRPPISNVNMTPREKMEKLRWRQQMQARIAVEQQQQQLLASQNGDGNAMYQKQQVFVCHNVTPNQTRRTLKFTSDLMNTRLHPLEANQRLVVKEGQVLSTNDRGDVDYSLEGSVLCQLKSTVSALDIGTRLCIRDALYRLARSAMKRRAAGTDYLNGSQGSKEQDNNENAVESSTASGPPSSGNSRATSSSVVETQTNPIDRSIAKLLFSKPQAPMFGRPCGFT